MYKLIVSRPADPLTIWLDWRLLPWRFLHFVSYIAIDEAVHAVSICQLECLEPAAVIVIFCGLIADLLILVICRSQGASYYNL